MLWVSIDYSTWRRIFPFVLHSRQKERSCHVVSAPSTRIRLASFVRVAICLHTCLLIHSTSDT